MEEGKKKLLPLFALEEKSEEATEFPQEGKRKRTLKEIKAKQDFLFIRFYPLSAHSTTNVIAWRKPGSSDL
jgi:hypothetical protein